MTNPPQNPGGPQWGSAPEGSQPHGSPAPQYGQPPSGGGSPQPQQPSAAAPQSSAAPQYGAPAQGSPVPASPYGSQPVGKPPRKGGAVGWIIGGCGCLLLLVIGLIVVLFAVGIFGTMNRGDGGGGGAAAKPSKVEYEEGMREIMIEDQGMSEDLMDSPEVQPYFTCLTDESYDRVSPEGARKIANGDPNISVSDAEALNDAIEACDDELGV